MIEIQHFLASILIALLGFIGVTPAQEMTFGATPALTVPQGGTGWGNIQGGTLIYGTGSSLRVGTTSTTTATCSGSASCSPFTVIGNTPVTISAVGGGNSGLSTTSPVSSSNVLVYSSAGAGSAFGAATSSLTANTPLSLSQPISVLGSAASALSIDTSGSWTGNAGTATALAANGSNCTAGSAAGGVNASGVAEDCTDYWTEAENTSAGYVQSTRTLTVAGTANQITSSAGAQDLSANRTWTLSLPNHVIFPNSFFATNSTTTNATTTNLTAHQIFADASDGLLFKANNGTDVAILGAGNSANATFYGGLNVDGATRLATSLTGLLKATAGAVTAATAGVDYENPLTFNAPLSRNTNAISLSTTTNSLFTGTAGQVLAFINGGWTGVATTTAGTGLTYTGSAFNVNTSQNITTLSNLTSDGVVYTSGSNGTLNVDSGALDVVRGGTGATTLNDLITLATHTTGNFIATITGTANQVSVSGSGSENAGVTLSLPAHIIGTGLNMQFGSTTHATSTNLDITSKLTFNGVTGTTWSAFCTAITGGAGLCDGTDDGAAGGSAFEVATTSDIAVSQLAYINKTTGRTTLASVATTTLVAGTNVSFSGGTPVILGSSAITINATGGGSGNMSGWATTTTAGQLLLYPVNATSTDVLFGDSSTSTAPLYFDISEPTLYIGNGIGSNASSTTQYGSSTNAFLIGKDGLTGDFRISSSTVDEGFNVSNVLSIAKSTLLTTFNYAVTFIGNIVASANVDFGGATFLEIPNGANPTANDVGEIAHDTTDNQLIVDDAVIPTRNVKIWGTTVGSTSPAFRDGGLLKVPTQLDGYTMTAIRCSVQSGTSKVIAVEDESANATEDITCATSVTSDDGSITNATVTAGEEMYIDFGATSGAVDYVTITVFGDYARE